jgi:hypothetical protein
MRVVKGLVTCGVTLILFHVGSGYQRCALLEVGGGEVGVVEVKPDHVDALE